MASRNSTDVFDLDGKQIDGLTVGEIMSPAVATAKKDEKVSEVLSRMKKYHLRELPVLDGDKPIGFVGYSSLLLRRSLPLSARVDQIMLPVPRLLEDMKVTKAVEELMSAGVRSAPVVRNEKMVGILSRTDLIKLVSEADQLKDKPVRDVMTENPQSVRPDEGIRRAEILMKNLMEKTLPVVDEQGKLLGSISMHDVLDFGWNPKDKRPMDSVVGKDREAPDVRVKGLMNEEPISIAPDDTLEMAARTMMDNDIATVFVEEAGGLVGVISQADLMEQIIGLEEKEGVYVQITGLDEHDPDVLDTLYEQIGKSMNRVNKLKRHQPRVFTVHVAKHRIEGFRAKYSIQARLTTDHGMYYAKASEWALFKTMDMVLDYIEKEIRKEHEKDIEFKKTRRRL